MPIASASRPARAAPELDGRAEMRRLAFLVDDGVVICATLRALRELGVVERSLAGERSVAELCPDLPPSGFGYLRAGLRTLAGQGWLADASPTLDPATTVLRWTPGGRGAAERLDDYAAAGRFLAGFASSAADAWSRPWGRGRADELTALLGRCVERRADAPDGAPDARRAAAPSPLESALVVPVLVWLSETGRLLERGPSLPGGAAGSAMGALLEALGWLDRDGRWTEPGRWVRDYAPHFGIVASYLPLLGRLPELYRGELTVDQPVDSAPEWHVERGLNVRASAAAHARYFADADEIFVEVFDRLPLERQPRFVIDVGCGDGAWLVHLHQLIRDRTRRGRHLDEHPLPMIAADVSDAALAAARRRFEEASVPGLALRGDVGDPDALAGALRNRGLAIEDGLHVRAFVDHDRSYAGEDPNLPVPGYSSGAYVDASGRPLGGEQVERDLVAHMARWAPHVRRHGLVVLEAHCVPPAVARQHLGSLHSVAFDAYHAYSHQYLVDHSAFVECCRRAGLERVLTSERHYPTRRPFVAVSLNRFVAAEAAPPPLLASGGAARRAAPPADDWQPGPGLDVEDGEALHRLLFAGGDLRRPRGWCAVPTGELVRDALAALELRIERTPDGGVVRVLDYGTGTGLAAILLVQGLREHGVDERLGCRGVRLELHLADLPSGWFAKAHELLAPCSWTRFHSLRGPDGFRPLADVLGEGRIDVAIASMVFHLIPPPALPAVAAGLAEVLAPGGRLVWSSPDLGPPAADAVLFHDVNRAVRSRWLAAHAGELDAETLERGRERADRRILPLANGAAQVADALARHLTGDLRVAQHEMTDRELLDALLVPSNQAEFLSEIASRAERERAIRTIMLDEVIPELRATPAGSPAGLGVQWTFGSHGAS